MSVWAQLARFEPEEIDGVIERIFTQYNQKFELLAVNEQEATVLIKLEDGKKVTVPIRKPE
jgi:hypothetical protein